PDASHDVELAVEMVDHRGAALDPVAAINVAQAKIVADHGVMDVAANDAVEAAPPPGFRGERALVFADEGHGVLDLQLGPFRQRPIGQAERAPDRVEVGVDEDREIVGIAAQQREPTRVARKSSSLSAWQPRVPRWTSDRNSVRTRRAPLECRSSMRCPAHGALISDFYCKHMTGAWS